MLQKVTMTYRDRGKSPGPFTSIRSIVSTKSNGSNSKTVKAKGPKVSSTSPKSTTTKSSSSSTQDTSSYSSLGSNTIISPSSKPPRSIRRGSLGTAKADVTAIVSSRSRIPLQPTDDDVSVRSGRTSSSLNSFRSRRMLGLPIFGGGSKEETAQPKSPSLTANATTLKNADAMQRHRSATPTKHRGRSNAPLQQKPVPMKSPLMTPTQKKARSKASYDSIPDNNEKIRPGATLPRMDSGCFHQPFSSSDEDHEKQTSSLARSGRPRRGASPRNRRPMKLEKTWSCSAMSVHSAGDNSAEMNLYIDEDDESDFDTDDEAERIMSRNGSKEKKRSKKAPRRGKRAPRRMTKNQRKIEKEAEQYNRTKAKVDVIHEAEDESGDEDDELQLDPAIHATGHGKGSDLHDSNTTDSLNSHGDLDDVASSCSYKLPAFGTILGLEPARKLGVPTAIHPGNGYSSDSSLVRKRMELKRQQEKEHKKIEKASKSKKKKKGNHHKENKAGGEEVLKKEHRSPGAYAKPHLQAFHESFANYGYDQPDEASVRSSPSYATRRVSTGINATDFERYRNARRSRSASRHRSKKDKKKKRKNKKPSLTAASTSDDDICGERGQSNNADNNDSFSTTVREKQEVTMRMQDLDACFQQVDEIALDGSVSTQSYEKRYEEIEKFEAFLFQERDKLQKERATIAFERESLELQLNEETNKAELLSQKVKDLEQQLHSLRLSHAGNNAELEAELEDLKANFRQQKRELMKQLRDKDADMEELKAREPVSSRSNHSDNSSDASTLGAKSRDRLQGELLQINSKLIEKQQMLERQASELEDLQIELSGLRDGSIVSHLREEVQSLRNQKLQAENDLTKERKDNASKLKDKDATIIYLMSELARLKQEQSHDLSASNHSRNSLSSLAGLRRGNTNNSVSSFLPPGLSLQAKDSGGDDEESMSSTHRRSSISNILGFGQS